jgi:hypothetical protein
MCLVRPYLDDGSPYWPSPLDDVFLSLLRGAGMVSAQPYLDCCPLGPCGVSAACLLLSEQACWAELDLFSFLPGVGLAEGSCGVVPHVVKAEIRGRGHLLP